MHSPRGLVLINAAGFLRSLGVGLLGVVLAVYLARIGISTAAIGIVLTLFFTLWSFAKSVRASYYAELDRMYFDLLKMAIERPYLLEAGAASDPVRQREYELYAFMIWNFLETVYDRCGKNKQLTETWYPPTSSRNDGWPSRCFFEL